MPPRRTPAKTTKRAPGASIHASCRWCSAEILWLQSSATGKLAPIDRHPVPDGNVVVHRDPGTGRVTGTYDVVGPAQATLDGTEPTDERPTRHLNHWITCDSPTARRLAAERARGGGQLHAADGSPVGRGPAEDRLGPPMTALMVHKRCTNPACGGPLGEVDLMEGHQTHSSCDPAHLDSLRRIPPRPYQPSETTP